METNKYKVFEVTLKDGLKVQVQAPTQRVTESYAKKCCWHWINKQELANKPVTYNDIIKIIGIK